MQLRELNQSQGVVQSLSNQRQKKTELGVDFSNVLSQKQMNVPKEPIADRKLNSNNIRRDKSVQPKRLEQKVNNDSDAVKSDDAKPVDETVNKEDAKVVKKDDTVKDAPDTKDAKKAVKEILNAVKGEGKEIDEETIDAVMSLLANPEVMENPELKELMSKLQGLMEMLTLEQEVGMDMSQSSTASDVIETVSALVESLSQTVKLTPEQKEALTDMAKTLEETSPVTFEDTLKGLAAESTETTTAKSSVDQEINNLFSANDAPVKEATTQDANEASKAKTPKIVIKETKEESASDSKISEEAAKMMQVEGKNTLISSANQVQQVQASPQLERNIVSQVMEVMQAEIQTTEDVQTMIVRLKPQELGNVELRVSIDKGVVLAEMQVENEIVKAAVETNLNFLKDTLQEKGIELDKFNVNIDSGFQSESQDQQQQQANKQSKGFSGFIENPEESMEELLAKDMGNENINIRV